MSFKRPSSHRHELLEHLRAALLDEAAPEHSESVEVPVPFALDRDDDGDLKCSTVVPLWDPVSVDRRLDELINSRWTRSWRRSGEAAARPPMITEVDASGVERRHISRWVSPTELEQLAQQARRLRLKQADSGEQLLSFQHILIQALQERVVQAQRHVRSITEAPVEAGRPWEVGDLVRYCGEHYNITVVTPRKITCESQQCGTFDVTPGSIEARGLRLIAAGLRVAPGDR